MISRQAPAASLLGAVGRASAGRPGLVLVGGDAGVGKTRLVGHVAREAGASGARVVVVHCVDLGQVGIPYLPFTEALAQLQAGVAGPEAAAEVAGLAAERPALWRLLEPGGTAGAEHDERLQLFEGIARSLGAAGEPGHPLVLVVEDIHWADASTRDVLRFLAVRARSENLLVVATYRADDVDRRHPLRPVLAELSRLEHADRIDLGPFDEHELRDFTTALAGRALTAAEFCDVRDRSEGNAFFAEELLEAGPGAGSLPWTLTEVLRTRLERLDPDVQQAVRLASVAGRRVREEVLRAAARQQVGHDVDAALREAVTQQVLVVAGDHLEFRHALLAEVLYADLLPGERIGMHRAYLAALTQQGADGRPLGGPAERAHHAVEGNDLQAALRAAHEAAVAARNLLAPAEELGHREQVLELWDSVPDAGAILGTDLTDAAVAAGEAAAKAGDPERAVRHTEDAVGRLAGDPARQAAMQHVLARRYLDLPEDGGHIESSVGALRSALEILPDPSPDRVWSYALLARLAMALDRDDEARAEARRAVAGARALGEHGALAEALTTLAVLDVADADAAARHLTEATEAAVRAGDVLTEVRCLYSATANRFYAGHLDDAECRAARTLARADELGLTWSTYGVVTLILQEVMLYFRGDLTHRPVGSVPPAWRRVLEATRLYAAVARGDEDAISRGEALNEHWREDGQIALLAGGCLTDACTWAGRYDDALGNAQRVIDHLGKVWDEHFLGGIWISALALAALADAAEADRSSGRAGQAARGSGADQPGGTRDQRMAGRLERADALLARAQETARRGRPRGGVLGPEGRAWLLRAAAEHARLRAVVHGDWAAAAGVWRETVDAFGFGYRYEQARSRYRWAEALLGTGEKEQATTAAAEALAEAEAIGATPLAEAVRALGRRARLGLPMPEGAPGSPAASGGGRDARDGLPELTDREAEVLALVADGLSNRQVGERLYISAKTASVHVSNIMAKLGASGRAEAVSLAHRRGLLDG
ncbi:helix-turn-helix transcriptional regulator [Myceligenerans crystallogenes]|uniref:Helix-turn-helix transcriptional regulator n=1 Tax=Myceligenerans crystallogenes TaxID=316335 RepID=A0ABP4ZCS2_9MICO